MAFLYGRAGRLHTKNGGFRPGQAAKYTAAHAAGQKAFHARFYDPEVGGYAPCLLACHGTSAHGSQASRGASLSLSARLR
jgi:hypothetical protein